MKKKNIFIITMSILIIGLVIYGIINIIGNNKKEIVLDSNQTVENINFSDVTINKVNGKYIFKVTLTTDSDIYSESFDATITDKKGKTIETLSGYIGDINVGEEKKIEITSEKNLSKAYQVSYTVYKE